MTRLISFSRVLSSAGRALASCLHWRVLLLSLWPCIASLLLWGCILWLALQPLVDWMRVIFAEFGLYGTASTILAWVGLGAFKLVVVPLIAMWFLLPLMLVTTALVYVGLMVLPSLVKHVASRRYPHLLRNGNNSFWGSMRVSLSTIILFMVAWLVTLPLSFLPPFNLLLAPMLWGWLTYRIMVYEVLAAYATVEERRAIERRFRWPLMCIGVVSGVLGTAPTLAWLGGALSVVFFPFLAAIAIWIYVAVFCFTSLWFAHYCLGVLSLLRRAEQQQPASAQRVTAASDTFEA